MVYTAADREIMTRIFTKFRKGRIRGIIREGTARTYNLQFGEFGLFALEKGKLTKEQLEEGRRVISRELNKSGKMWIRTYPDIPVTSKPIGTRMGKGKGAISHYVARVREGMFIYEITGVEPRIAKQALVKAEKKLPIKAKVFKRPIVLKPTEYE